MYKSKFEKEVAEYFGKQVRYETDKIPFVQPEVSRMYNPDFTLAPGVYIETKGKLTLEDRKKHLWVKEQHPELHIIFLFMNSTNKLTKRSKTTYANWAEEHGFDWFCWRTKRPPKTIKELLNCTSIKLLKPMKVKSNSRGNSRKKKWAS